MINKWVYNNESTENSNTLNLTGNNLEKILLRVVDVRLANLNIILQARGLKIIKNMEDEQVGLKYRYIIQIWNNPCDKTKISPSDDYWSSLTLNYIKSVNTYTSNVYHKLLIDSVSKWITIKLQFKSNLSVCFQTHEENNRPRIYDKITIVSL